VDVFALKQQLAVQDWQSQFDRRSLERGVDYVRNGRVLELEHVEQVSGDRVVGRVRGHGGNVYSVTVTIVPDVDLWKCSCSCPVGGFCKHAVALLMFADQFPPDAWREPSAAPAGMATAPRRHPRPPVTPAAEPAPNTEWVRWLQGCEQSRAQAPGIVEPGRVFGLLLHAGYGAIVPTCQVAPAWFRPGKTRSLVDPKAVLLTHRGPEPAPADGWADGEAMALATLLSEYGVRHAGLQFMEISGAHQREALLALATRHPLFFERASDGAYALGAPLPLQLRWQDLANGSQRLAVAAAGDEGTALLRGAGLWYVQPHSRRFGRVEASTHWLDLVGRAPELRPEDVESLRELLARRGKDAPPIPLPEVREPPRRIAGPPRAVLRLRTVEVSWRQNWQRRPLTAGCARLSFDYEGLRVRPDFQAQTRVRRDDRVFEIERDRRGEQRFEDSLEQAGFCDASLFAHDYNLRRVTFEHGDYLLQPNERKPPFAPEAWKNVLERLAEQGFVLEYEPDFPRHELVAIDAWHADLAESGNAWFDVSLGIELGGERVDLLPILRRVLANPAFSLAPRKGERKNAVVRIAIDETRNVELPVARLRALIEPLLEWLEDDRAAAPRVHRSEAGALARLAEDAGLAWHGGEKLRAQLEALQRTRRDAVEPPGFGTRLRGYQRDGLAWLEFLADSGLGGILADDMGLGKTVQVLAHLLAEKQRGRLDAPALVIAPTSLVGNWRDEAARFAPDLRVLVLHGADRAERYDSIPAHDLVITTYALLPRDRERMVPARFALLILDEAQAIKNAKSQAAQIVRELNAKRRLAMTGTPLENHLGELWAQFDAVEPGLLGSERQFARFYRTPIEKRGDAERQARLNRRIAPLMLRRRKDDVLAELPTKTEIVQRLELDGAQRELYETLRLAQHERVRDAIRKRGLAQSGIIVLDALLKLRQVCCDPRLVKLDSARKVTQSAKLDALLERLDGLLGEGRRVLLFSQFAEMLELIAVALAQRGIGHLRLTGGTPGADRAKIVRRFQNGEVPVFLISLKAGGVGLNLTAADVVIHYDPWWNPAVEAQATDRAHRIGQDKPVFVYKLICAGTVEEKIQALQARKSDLARAVLEGGTSQKLKLDEAELAELFGGFA
jgi:superfamily II DNA or RNA helicase